jgi:hypothetical protein
MVDYIQTPVWNAAGAAAAGLTAAAGVVALVVAAAAAAAVVDDDGDGADVGSGLTPPGCVQPHAPGPPSWLQAAPADQS